LDTYLDALQDFPKNPDRLFTEVGTAVLIKTNVFKRSMVYVYQDASKKGKFITLSVERVKEVMAMNARKEKPMELQDSKMLALAADEVIIDYDDVTGAIELPMEERRRKKGRGRSNRNRRRDGGKGRDNSRGGRADNRGKGNNKKTEKGGKKENKTGDNKSSDARKKPNTKNKTVRKEGDNNGSEKPAGNKDRRGRGNRNNRNKNRANRNNRGKNGKNGGNKDTGGGDKK